MMTIKKQKISRKRGQPRAVAVTETALMLPLLVLLMLLAVDFGRFVTSYISITNACRSGAYYGCFNPVNAATKAAWDANIRQAIENELATNSWFNPADLTLQTPLIIDEGLLGFRRVEVEISYPFTPVITWLLLPGYNSAHIMTRKVVMRQIRA